MSVCKKCGGSILWALTEKGVMMPLNIGVDPVQGNVAVRRDGKRLIGARTITKDRPLLPGESPYLAHWATCTSRQPKPKPPKPEPEPGLF